MELCTIERSLIYAIIADKSVIQKTSLKSEDFGDDVSRRIFSAIKSTYDKLKDTEFINKNILKLIGSKTSILEDEGIEEISDLEKIIFNSCEEEDLDWLYFQNVIIEKRSNDKYSNILEYAHEKVQIGEWTISDSEAYIKEKKQKIVHSKTRCESIRSNDYINEYKNKTKEIRESNKTIYYQIPIGKDFENNCYVEKGNVVNLVAETGGGKTIYSVYAMVQTAKKYKNEKFLFITGENTKEKILDYIYASYFDISYVDIQMRNIEIDRYIENLSEGKREEWNQIFSRIYVKPLPNIPLNEVKEYLDIHRDNDDPFDFIVIDSFDNVDEIETKGESTLFEFNAVKIEKIAIDYNLIAIVTAQLKSNLYDTDIEEITKNCVFNTNNVSKKSSFMILFHYKIKTENKLKTRLGLFQRLVKARGGGLNMLNPITPDFENVRFRIGSNINRRVRLKGGSEIE